VRQGTSFRFVVQYAVKVVIKALHTTLPLPSKIDQIDGLQILRAVAVLLVAWVHAGQWLLPISAQSLPSFGVYGIDIFFVISGFIVSSLVLRSRQKPGATAMWEFLKRRLIRIFPIYWLFCLLQIGRLLHNRQLFQRNYLPVFFLLPGLRHIETPLLVDFSWTMIFEMFFYYTLAVILLGTVRRGVPTVITAFCAAVVFGGIFDIRRPIWIVLCNPIVLEFVFGAFVALAYRHFGRLRRLGIVLLILGSVASISLAIFPSGAIATGPRMVLSDSGVMVRVMTWGIAATMVVGGMVFWSPAIRSRLGRVAVVLGNSSYSAYLASAMVIEFTMRLLLKVLGGSVPFSVGRVAVYQVAVTICVFVAGWVCYQFVEWPMLRWLQGRFLTKTP
jgi:peptidoglycan/LPS O-acetylase OafA/YrhL